MATNQIKLVINATDNSSTALKSLANNINNVKKGVLSLSNDTTAATSNVGGMNATLTKTPGLFSKIGQGAKRALTIFGGYKLLTGVFNSITGAMNGAISRIDTLDLFQRKMEILTQSPTDAAYALEHMKKATKGTAYGLDTAAKAVQNFVTRGMSTKDATASIETWMDAVAVYGNGTNEALASVINALGKMRSKGTVEMRHINSMINAGINPVQLYAKATGQSAAEVQTQLSEKTLRTEEFLNVVENALRTGAGGVAKVTGMAKEMATTWQATFDNMHFALNRGWAEMIDGADSLLKAFSENGLKGVFKGFGEGSENIMTGIGKTLNRAGQSMRDFYSSFIANHEKAKNIADNTELINLDIGARINPQTKEIFKNSFLGALGGYAEKIAAGFVVLENTWARFRQALAQGINQISPQLGQLFGTLFGEGVSNATDLLNVFLNWATLKLPQFFNWVQEKLIWLIEHKDSVINAAEMILKAFIGWQALKSIQNIIVGFNEKLKALNTTLGFFTGGRLQLPTLETMGQGVKAQAKKSSGINLGKASTVARKAKRTPITNLGKPDDVIDIVAQKDQLNKISNPAATTSKGISDLFNGLWKNITGGFKNFVGFLDTSMNNALKGVKSMVETTVTKVGSLMGTLKTKSTDVLTTVANNIGSGFKKIGETFAGAGYAFKEVLLGIGRVANDKALSPIGKGLSNFIKEGYAPEIAKGKEAKKRWGASFHEAFDGDIAGAKNFIAHPIKTVKGGVGKVTGKIGEKAKPVVEGMGVSFHKAFDSDIEWVKDKAASVGTFFSNKLINPIGNVFSKIGGFATEHILPAIGWVGDLGAAFMGAVPMIALVTAAVGALTIGLGMLNPDNALSNGITTFFENFNKLVLSFGEYAQYMIQNFVNGIITNGDQLRQQGVNLILSVVTGILTAIPNIIATGIRILGALIAGIVQVLPTLVYQGFMAIGQFVAGLISAIPDVLQGIGNILLALAEFILTNAPMFIESGIQLIWNIITGIVGMVGQVIGAIGDLLGQTWDWIISGDALATFQDVGSKLVDWMLVGLAKTSWGATVLGWFGQDADAILQKAETDGAKTGENYTQNLQATIDTAPVDLTSFWNNANIEQNNQTAQEMGLAGGQAYVDAEQAAIDGATVDTDVITESAADSLDNASTAGAEVGSAYADSATNALNEGSENVSAAASNISSQLSLSFDTATVQQQATDFVNTIAIVFTEQAPLLYQTTGNIGVGAVNEFVGKVNENLPLAYACSIGLMSYFKQGIDEGYNSVREAVSLGLLTVAALFSGSGETFRMYGTTAGTQFSEGFIAATPLAVQYASDLKTLMLEQLRIIPESTYDIGRQTVESFHNGFVSTQSTIETDFTSLVDTLKSRLEAQMEQMSVGFNTIAGSMMDNVHTTLNKGFNDVKQLVGDKRLEIENTFHSIISAFETMGVEMMDSLAKGIGDNMQKAIDKTSELVQKLKETFETGLGIHSPSDYTTWVGQMMLLGLEEGMTPADVASWITNVIGDMQNSFANGSFNAAETMDFLSQQGALDLIAKVTGMDLSAIENAETSIPGIVQAAKKEVNYKSPGGSSNSKYGLKYGNPGDWCVSFVRAMAEEAGVGFPATNYVPDVVSWAQREGRWTNTPMSGYAAIYGGGKHIEIVESVDAAGNVTTIGGNTGSPRGVYEHVRNGATGYVALDGGHGVGSTLLQALQNAYNLKYGIDTTSIDGTGGFMGGLGAVMTDLGLIGYPLAVKAPITSLYGFRIHPVFGVGRGHAGIDLGAAMGTPILSATSGTVSLAGGYGGYGNAVMVNSGGVQFLYGHMSRIGAQVGQNVSQGQVIGFVGSTGWSTGPHLHFEIRAGGGTIDPLDYLLAAGQPGYAVGTRYVPRDMLAMIHEGEAVIPAGMNPYNDSGGDYLADLAAAMFNSSGITADTSNLGTGSTTNNQTITIEAPVTVNIDGDTNAQEIANNIGEEMHRALTRAISLGNAR